MTQNNPLEGPTKVNIIKENTFFSVLELHSMVSHDQTVELVFEDGLENKMKYRISKLAMQE
jgi:hypothetical protein